MTKQILNITEKYGGKVPKENSEEENGDEEDEESENVLDNLINLQNQKEFILNRDEVKKHVHIDDKIKLRSEYKILK